MRALCYVRFEMPVALLYLNNMRIDIWLFSVQTFGNISLLRKHYIFCLDTNCRR